MADARGRRRLHRLWPPCQPGELVFAVVGLPVAVLCFGYVFAVLYAGTLLVLTLVGLPVLAVGLAGARGLGRLHRSLVCRLLGERIEEPPPVPVPDGIPARIRAGLADPTGWWTMLYLVCRLPAALLHFVAAAVLIPGAGWLIGFPLWDWLLEPDEWPAPWWMNVGAVAGGLLFLSVAPVTIRMTSGLNRWLARVLLSPPPEEKRVGTLRRARSALAAEGMANLRRIERDLHDGTQAELVAIAITLSLADDELDRIDGAHQTRLAELMTRVRAQTDGAITGLRRIIRGINPVALDTGLSEALPALTAGCGVPVTLDMDLTERADPAIERVAYFCVAELLTNVTRHSAARTASVEVVVVGGQVRIRVCDDGKGGAAERSGSGIPGLRERLDAVDGTLAISSPAGGPTVITIRLPAGL